MADKKVIPMPDLELEAQLKRYAASKELRKDAEKRMLADFSEVEEDSVTINQTFDDTDLVIEEDDDEIEVEE